MQLRKFVLSAIAMIISGTIFAQDKIYKTDGDVISAKIKSIGTKTVTYTRFDNQSGPEYTIVKNQVTKITYQNGSEDVFDDVRPARPHRHLRRPSAKDADEATTGPKINYKPNLISLAPIQFSENGLGAGLSYERAIDKAGIIAFYLPVLATFDLNTTYTDNTGMVHNGNQDAMFYAMPGVKIYPTGSFGVVKYAVGPSLVIASGQKSSYSTDYYGNSYYTTQDHTMLGMEVNNSLNINPSPHIYLGLEFGFGFTYLNRVGGLNQDTQGLVQGSFKIGYRF